MNAGTGPVVAVVVTHDRRRLLEEALVAISRQSRPPDVVIVIDNASGDGTAAFVREAFPEVELVALKRNTGGAGGFAVGIARALDHHDAGLLWLLDDDTIASPRALESLLAARHRSAAITRERRAAALIASRVVWTDGRDHPMNTPRLRPGTSSTLKGAARAIGCYPIRSASFVSVLVEADAVRRSGLPIADYFLWNDDFEFTTRLLRKRSGLCCQDSIVVHKTATFGATDINPGPRFFYEVRNKLWLFTRSPGLAPAERMLYAASTARRWARTLALSEDRGAVFKEFRRGLISGFRTSPELTVEILRDLEMR